MHRAVKLSKIAGKKLVIGITPGKEILENADGEKHQAQTDKGHRDRSNEPACQGNEEIHGVNNEGRDHRHHLLNSIPSIRNADHRQIAKIATPAI